MTVDYKNKFNVIYQNNFMVDNLQKAFEFLDNCFKLFDENTHPILVIENLNGGGYADLADYCFSYINLNKYSTT